MQFALLSTLLPYVPTIDVLWHAVVRGEPAYALITLVSAVPRVPPQDVGTHRPHAGAWQIQHLIHTLPTQADGGRHRRCP